MILSQLPLAKIPILKEFYFGKYGNISAKMELHNHPQYYSNKNNNLIHHHSAHVASKLPIAYQGVGGAYGEAAAMKAYPNCETLQCHQFKDAIQAVEGGWAEAAVIPIENSIGGSVLTNYDLLLRHSLHVVGETLLSIDHCLLALPGVSIHHLTRVFSHPQALAQCEMSVTKLGVTTSATDNTAVAAQIVASQGVRENGAIASARAAQLYGLHILAHKFQDQTNNVTRFLKLAKTPIIPTTDTTNFKTSIAFIPNEGSQELYKALSIFAQSGNIRISKIESRPLEKHANKVVNGFKNGGNILSIMEPRAQCALKRLEGLASYVRVIGCYPMEDTTC